MTTNRMTLALGALGMALVIFSNRQLPWTWPHVAGLCLMLPSAVLFAMARMQLGDAFSVRPEARRLVTTGLYARIRNPIYVFAAMLLASLVLFANKPVYLLALVGVIPMQIVRARREAAVLEAAFGDEYRDYKRRTWF